MMKGGEGKWGWRLRWVGAGLGNWEGGRSPATDIHGWVVSSDLDVVDSPYECLRTRGVC